MAGPELLIGERMNVVERPLLDRFNQPSKQTEAGNTKVSFGDILSKSLSEVNQAGIEADKEVGLALTGKAVNPHGALLALQEAEISFNLMTSIKERLETAYQQLVRMQL